MTYRPRWSMPCRITGFCGHSALLQPLWEKRATRQCALSELHLLPGSPSAAQEQYARLVFRLEGPLQKPESLRSEALTDTINESSEDKSFPFHQVSTDEWKEENKDPKYQTTNFMINHHPARWVKITD
eukprot:GHVP01046602.1.p2 GENE.GHVP01046602.1~~GHVP01046602.1.p2  ORF type:complete len:128 (+),score=22.47 GHVP01046602.1:573-956(+)